MISSKLTKSMQDLLAQWFAIYDTDRVYEELRVLGFMSGVQSLDRNFIPVFVIQKLNTIVSFQESPQSDFFQRDVAIVVHNDPETITRQGILLTRWSYSKAARAVYLKDRLYYIGCGYLLDSNLKPLIMATYSIKEFQQNHVNHRFMHNPTLHIAPELLTDSYWRKLITEYMIPVALEVRVRLSSGNRYLPKKYLKVTQNIDVRVHELGQFVLPIEIPSLTTNISEELTAITKTLTGLPAVLY